MGRCQRICICSALDDLQCVFASVEGFLAGQKQTYMPILSVLDNEEVGSQTKQGAASTFYMTHLPALTPVSDFLMKTTLFGLQTAL